MQAKYPQITGLVLAGGRARRLGGVDKGLIVWRGRPLVAYAIDAIRAVADAVLISANRHLEHYAAFGFPVVPDATADFQGPLAGLLSGLNGSSTPYLMTVPCDSPEITGPLLARLVSTMMAQDAEIAVAHDGQRLHPMFMLVKREVGADLKQFLDSGERKVALWLARHRLAITDYRDRPEMFININSPEDLADLQAASFGPENSLPQEPHR